MSWFRANMGENPQWPSEYTENTSDMNISKRKFSVPEKVTSISLHLPSSSTLQKAFHVQHRMLTQIKGSCKKVESVWLVTHWVISLNLWIQVHISVKGIPRYIQHRFHHVKNLSLIISKMLPSAIPKGWFFNLPRRSVGPVPKFSPLIVTFVHAMPSLGEIPVTSGGCRARDMMNFQLLQSELLLSVYQEIIN